jgi:hypothetical protein
MKTVRLILILTFASLVSGCGGSKEATVSGKVTLDGSPITTGTIVFIPSAAGTQAYGAIEQSGSYELFTGQQRGLKPGDYVATVVAREKPPTNVTELGGPAPPGKAITPRWYAAKETSGLNFTIAPGANEINLELTSQPPAGWKEPARR